MSPAHIKTLYLLLSAFSFQLCAFASLRETFSFSVYPGTDSYEFDTERDFWEWEEAETLKSHYEALQEQWT